MDILRRIIECLRQLFSGTRPAQPAQIERDMLVNMIAIGKFVSIGNLYINDVPLTARRSRTNEPLTERRSRADAINNLLQNAQSGMTFYRLDSARVPDTEHGLKDFMETYESQVLTYISDASSYTEAKSRADAICITLQAFYGSSALPTADDGTDDPPSTIAGGTDAPQAESLKCTKGMVWNPVTMICE